MDWLNKSAEQNLDEILALADVNARLRVLAGVEKRADESWWQQAQNLAGNAGQQLSQAASTALPHLQNAAGQVSDWARNNPWPAAGLGGAALGGLGMAALNRLNPDEDERDLVGSLGSGAAIGAGLGLGGMALAKHLPTLAQPGAVTPDVEQLTQQIDQQAQKPFVRPLARDAAAAGVTGALQAGWDTTVGMPARAVAENLTHAVENPGVLNTLGAAGGLAAGTAYANDLAHYVATRANLASGRGMTNDPEALRRGISGALQGVSDKGMVTATSPSWFGRLRNLLSGRTPATPMTADQRQALLALQHAAPSELQHMLNAGAAGRPYLLNNAEFQPRMVQQLANSQGYTGRAGTPLRYEVAKALEGRLPQSVESKILPRLTAKLQTGTNGTALPTMRAPNLVSRAMGSRMRGARAPLALLALSLLNRRNEGQ